MMINIRISLGVPPIPQIGVDWAELPQEIIELISKRLIIYADYLRFRCVCRTWNSSVPKIPLHLPPQLPWLLLSPNCFCDVSTHKLHLLDIPLSYSHNTRICGSSFGWLVILYGLSGVRLFNPITHRSLFLPPLNTLPRFFRMDLDFNNSQILNKVVLSSRPSLSDDFAAFAVLNSSVLAFCRKGYDSWVLLNVNGNHLWMDVVFKNGLFYAVSTSGILAVCDVEGPRPRVSIIETTNSVNLWMKIYYVVFSGEDMLLVSSYLLKKDVSQTKRFPILKMNWNALKWEEIQTMGEKMLFVGWRSSISISASDLAECPPNRIYFTNDNFRKDDLGIFSLSDKSIELLARYPLFSERRLGFPIWVTPNPL